MPKAIEVRESLPKTLIGKLSKKNSLRRRTASSDEHIADHTLWTCAGEGLS
jgi:non-ribosomal peptide synthetase component E (peptide arylation enzyme)